MNKLFQTNIPVQKAKVGETFSVMHPTDRTRVTGVGQVVEVESKKYPSAKVVFELIKGVFLGPDEPYL